ncbi:MAG TPA: xanthine dehydrogenase family protein subunit M [Thermoanaerobaculia bacterium]|jgi:xanthine dehydrogenase YagS FAD-binding subunit|nr:xanthine dehydrogenase family protein subunit M [Thermoanaerobaculia bacterium]
MNPFTYSHANRLEEAVAAVAKNPHAAFVAGGTTLVDLLRLDVLTPAALVDVNALPLARIETLPGGGVRIGAMVRNSDLANDPTIRQRYPVLSEALLSGASPQLRNMATTGGNLMQRTRCYYFRDAVSPCNKRQPGSGCAALGGFNRIHAVLGTSEKCIATHPGDMPVALAALDAVVHTRRPGGGERAIPLTDFHVAYGEDPARESVLEHGELITAVELPAVPWFARSAYLKIRDRASYEFALASAAVALDLDRGGAGAIRAARVALGGVATKPWRSREAEQVLTGGKADEATFRAAAEAALKDARPQRNNAFKIELAKRTLTRALAMAAEKKV